MNKTLALIKPDAVQAGYESIVHARIKKEGFSVLDMGRVSFSEAQARAFYQEHFGKPFFADLITFMSSGPSVWLILERDDAVNHWRTVIGATDPKQAAEGSLRKLLGTQLNRNAVHGSADDASAAREIKFVMDFLSRPVDGNHMYRHALRRMGGSP